MSQEVRRGWGGRLKGRPSTIEIEDEEDRLEVKPTISPTDCYEPPGPGEMFGRFWKSAEDREASMRRRQKAEDPSQEAQTSRQEDEGDSQWIWSPKLLERLERQAEKRRRIAEGEGEDLLSEKERAKEVLEEIETFQAGGEGYEEGGKSSGSGGLYEGSQVETDKGGGDTGIVQAQQSENSWLQ